MVDLTIRNYRDTPETRDTLFDFYRSAYPGMTELLDPARFEWQSFQNPLAPPDTNFLYHLYDETGEIIGQNILIPYRLMIDSGAHDALCSTNLIVTSNLVGKGLGHRLIEQHERLGRVCFAVGITVASSRAFQKRGWKPVDDSRLYSLFLHPAACLRFVGVSGALARILSAVIRIANPVVGALARVRIPSRIEGITHEPIASFDPAWDSVWQHALKPYAIHFVRCADFLNWKYCTRRDVRHQILLFRKAAEPIAYLVYRLSRNAQRNILLGRIVDFVYRPDIHPKLPHYIISVARQRLASEGVDGIVGVGSSRELRRAFRSNGMILSRPQPAIILERGFSLAELRAKYRNIWYITLGDSDLDNYW